MRSPCGYGSGASSTALISVKIAVFAPIPSASIVIAAIAKPGLRRRARKPPARSWRIASRLGISTCSTYANSRDLVSVSRLNGQLVALPARRVHQVVGLAVAHKLLGFRIPPQLPLQLARDVREVADADRSMPDLDVGIRTLARRNAIQPELHVILRLPERAAVMPFVDLFLGGQVELNTRRVDSKVV